MRFIVRGETLSICAAVFMDTANFSGAPGRLKRSKSEVKLAAILASDYTYIVTHIGPLVKSARDRKGQISDLRPQCPGETAFSCACTDAHISTKKAIVLIKKILQSSTNKCGRIVRNFFIPVSTLKRDVLNGETRTMPQKNDRIARIAADLDDIPIEKITYRVLALVGCLTMISLSILLAIDLLVRVWRVM